ncbi:MAG: acyl-CoA thioesterase [Pseudomonadota bacterium]
MITNYEALLSTEPLVVMKRVRWADCDPAGVVYTGKFTEYLLLAVQYLFDELGEGDYFKWVHELNVDTPCKGLDMEFHGALWPGDEFEMHCTVSAIREHSYDITVEAVQLAKGNRKVFTGRFSPICIVRGLRQRAPIPAVMRVALERFRPLTETQ